MVEVARTAAVEAHYGMEVGLVACCLGLQERKGEASQEGWDAVRKQWMGKTREDLALDLVLAAYRRFAGSKGERGASEMLLRRLVFEGGIRSINAVVDCLNMASAQTRVVLAAFDAEALDGEMRLDLTEREERLVAIGGKDVRIPPRELVLRCGPGLLSWVGRRDGEASKVTEATRRIWLLGLRVEGVGEELVERALMEAVHALGQCFVLRLETHQVAGEKSLA